MERVPLRALMLLFAAVAQTCLLAACSSDTATATTPARFEGVTLADLQGTPTRLGPEPGYLTVVNVWATWCAPCRRELPSLEKLSKLLDPQRFRVVGVSIDEDPHLVREYLRDKGVTFAGLIDPQAQQLGGQLELPTYPATFILDQNGEIVARIFGERVWHTQDTVHRLERTRAGERGIF